MNQCHDLAIIAVFLKKYFPIFNGFLLGLSSSTTFQSQKVWLGSSKVFFFNFCLFIWFPTPPPNLLPTSARAASRDPCDVTKRGGAVLWPLAHCPRPPQLFILQGGGIKKRKWRNLFISFKKNVKHSFLLKTKKKKRRPKRNNLLMATIRRERKRKVAHFDVVGIKYEINRHRGKREGRREWTTTKKNETKRTEPSERSRWSAGQVRHDGV